MSTPQPEFDITGRTAVVTGCSSGIGREICLTFASAGARIAGLDIATEGGNRLVQDITRSGGEALFCECNVAHGEEVEAAFRAVDDRFGQIDILVNDAFQTSHVRPDAISEAEFAHVMDVNVVGYFRCAQAAGRRMIKRGQGGAIVNLSSIAGSTALGRGNFAYSVSKGAVNQFTRELAVEWAPHGIRVNAIQPCQILTPGLQELIDDPKFDSAGLVKTFLHGIPLGRLGSPRDVALAALFLASDASRMITGILLPVDGGNLAMNAGATVGW
jgi:NAD(P)-dependent dehydrogenase (short-subunit alcohol dehydrogenase family)